MSFLLLAVLCQIPGFSTVQAASQPAPFMKLTTLTDLYIHGLQDLHSAETQLFEALPFMAGAASNPGLRAAFETHRAETGIHVSHLEDVLSLTGADAEGEKCRGMEGLLKEGRALIREEADPEVLDAGLIAAARKAEHYQIAGYSSVRVFAVLLGEEEVVGILSATLEQELATDGKLTNLVMAVINADREILTPVIQKPETVECQDQLREMNETLMLSLVRQHELAEELEAKNKDLQILINAASHDLRTPLVNVKGFASVIQDHLQPLRGGVSTDRQSGGELPEEHEEIFRDIEAAVAFIHASAGKMDGLLRGLLVFSRLGMQPPKLQTVNPRGILEESLAATQFQIEAAGAEVVIGELPLCRADPNLLGQVISNLIENALKYRDPERPLRLEISGVQNGGRCLYHFRDNGIGIAAQYQEKVFDLFHRVNPGEEQGHGLGLAIVRRAMDRMGGSVTLESALDKGTAFSLTLTAIKNAVPPVST
ncbi:MAG: multi-sensor signal transduction histidine kinase [Verrucomicrobiales bacterium]|nr:multi-sensor signal transduction histidine kinase [Verrucomicrobiales bacterium]